MACAPKSNSSIEAIEAALQTVRSQKKIQIPSHISDAHHSQARTVLGKGIGYRYPHDYGGYVKQQYLPDSLQNMTFYRSGQNGQEKQMTEFLQQVRMREEQAKK